ncbi:MAG TPA: peptide chain release factor N(5)-glutamine methyltransferase [Balneolales bacterium]|nr:peptide chain release factor N(5)-glutamine methyltransferase [Balneolales bacterium]
MAKVPEEWNVLSMLEWGTEYFEGKGIPNPRLSIEWLLADVLKIKRLDLYLQFDRPLSSEELKDIKSGILRRARHEPLQYIVGHTDFMNAHINVSPDVLVPRPETEQLVEIVLEQNQNDSQKRVLDIGTGSGCIAIALKQERSSWRLYGLDISNQALKLARENAQLNEVEVAFFSGDIQHPEKIEFPEEPFFDIIVSNPPYITPQERSTLDPEVREFEPGRALFHKDIFTLYRDIATFAFGHLNPGGSLYLEINEAYGQELQRLFDNQKWQTDLKQDYGGKDRFIICHKGLDKLN